MSGNVTTAGDMNVMPGGALRVAKTTIGGNLENGGTVQMNSEGGKPGNVLTVNGNYTGNNGLMTFNATLGGDNSPTDKMNVKGDTQGNTGSPMRRSISAKALIMSITVCCWRKNLG